MEMGIIKGHTIGGGFEEDWSFVMYCLDTEKLTSMHLEMRKDARFIAYVKEHPDLQPMLDMPDFAVGFGAARLVDDAWEKEND